MKPEINTSQDPILTDIHAFREDHARRFNFDLRLMYEDLVAAQQKEKRNVVSFPAKRIDQTKRNAA